MVGVRLERFQRGVHGPQRMAGDLLHAVDGVLRVHNLRHAPGGVRAGGQLRQLVPVAAEGNVRARRGRGRADVQARVDRQGQRPVGQVQAERGRVSRARADDPRRDARAPQVFVRGRAVQRAAGRSRQRAEAVAVVERGQEHAGVFRAGVHHELQHVLHRDAFHRAVFRPVSEVRRDQRRPDRAQGRHVRAQQIPARVAHAARRTRPAARRGRSTFPGRGRAGVRFRGKTQSKTSAGPRRREQPERRVRRPFGPVPVLVDHIRHVRPVLSHSRTVESVQVHGAGVRLDLTILFSIRGRHDRSAHDHKTGLDYTRAVWTQKTNTKTIPFGNHLETRRVFARTRFTR